MRAGLGWLAEGAKGESTTAREATAQTLAEDVDVVGDDAFVIIEDGRDAVDSDGAGDGLDAGEGVGFEGGFVVVAEVVGAELAEQACAAVLVADLLDEDLAGAGGLLGLRAVLVVDEERRAEDEDEDEGDHDVVVKAAALVGPEDVAVEELAEFHRDLPDLPKRWGSMTVSPPM